MGETTQAERLYLDQMTADFDETDAAPISTRLLRNLLNDADRLAEIERRVRELANEAQQIGDETSTAQDDAPDLARLQVHRHYARKLRALIDTEKEAGDEN